MDRYLSWGGRKGGKAGEMAHGTWNMANGKWQILEVVHFGAEGTGTQNVFSFFLFPFLSNSREWVGRVARMLA